MVAQQGKKAGVACLSQDFGQATLLPTPQEGFQQPYNLHGTMLGLIALSTDKAFSQLEAKSQPNFKKETIAQSTA